MVTNLRKMSSYQSVTESIDHYAYVISFHVIKFEFYIVKFILQEEMELGYWGGGCRNFLESMKVIIMRTSSNERSRVCKLL